MGDVPPVKQCVTGDPGDLCIDLALRRADVRSFGNHHQDAPAVGQEPAVLGLGAHVIDPGVKGLDAADLCTFRIRTGIALGCQHDTERHGIAPDGLRRSAAGGHGLEDIIDIALEERQHHLGLGVAETGVELDDLDAVGSLHEAAVQDTAQRQSLGHHGPGGLAHDFRIGIIHFLGRDERQSGIGAHTAGIGPLVAVKRPFVVLRQRHRIHVLALHEAEEGELRSGEEILHHHPALAEGMVQEHVGQRSAGLFQVLGDDNPLAGGQAVILEHGRERTGAHIGQRLVKVGKSLVGCRGNVVFGHQALGEFLGALDGRGGLAVAENQQAFGTERIRDAGGQGRFGTHHREVHMVSQGKGQQPFHIGVLERYVERMFPGAGIARGTIDFFHLGTAAQRLHDGILASAAANHQHGFTEALFQGDLLARNSCLLRRKRIYKTHIN